MDKKINDFLYFRAEKGMYGLSQAGIISHTALKEHLLPCGYEPAPITSVLWRHNNNGNTFTLTVNGFGIRHQRRAYALHLINSLQEKYEITQDWKGSL